MKVQRLRLTFARGDEAKELSHLEVMRALEQAMREAGLPIAYSEGRRSTAQISIAAPLPVSVTSSCDLADVFLSERVEPTRFVAALQATLPPGLGAARPADAGALGGV
jgi:radical SAM-linked protein